MRYNPSFFWRVFLVYAAISLAGLWGFSFFLAERFQLELTTQAGRELAVQANLLAGDFSRFRNIASAAPSATVLADLVDGYASSTGNRFTVIDAQGVVIADSHEDITQMSNHLLRPEVQRAMNTGSGQISRFSQTISEDLVYFALPVYTAGQLEAVVRSAYFTGDLLNAIDARRVAIFNPARVISLFLVLLAAVTAFAQAVSIEKLALIAANIADGNFRGRVPEKNALGLKKFARVINQLARNSAANLSDITADRNRLAAIFAGMVEGVIDVDQNQKILHINEAASTLLGVNAQESTGKAVWQEVRHSEITQALDEAIGTESVVKTQITLRFSDAKSTKEAVVDIYAASLSDDSGNPIGAVVVLHDISELKSLERIRTDFVANASHELKTPITAIRGLSESVIDDQDIDRETVLHFMNRVHAQSIRLSQLVGDLMTLSRLESDHESGQFSIINMNELVRGSVSSAETAIEEKQQQLKVDIPEVKIEVYGDRQNLSQLVDNLIDNAVKYTPDKGAISISLGVEENALLLKVSDTGIGISEQYQQRIFERFYRIDKARSKSLGGTGLGLSIVKNIAEKHDGSIEIKSQPGRGSTFSYRMPLVH